MRFPGLSTEQESAWARLLTVGGGKDRGAVFIPEVNDEVLVAFEGGDPRQPVVLGGLFGDQSKIPRWAVEGGVVSARRMTSRLGHYVELSDGESPETQHVAVLLAGEEHKFRVGKDRVDLQVPAGVPVAIKSGDASITITNEGKLVIEALEIEMNAQVSVKINGATLEATAEGEMKLASDGVMSVKGATATVEGEALLQVKGAMVQIN